MRFSGVWKGLLAVFVGVLLLLLVLAVEIYRFSAKEESSHSDVAIVLGAAVWDGEPSPVFLERINHAVELQTSDVVSKIIFTGGVGKGDDVSEAEVGMQTAVALGISAEDIFIETNSAITYENLKEACKIMQAEDLEFAILVSDPLHMKRAMRMANDLGLDVESSPTPTTRYQTWRSKIPSLIYETWFYALYLGQRPFLEQSNCGMGKVEE